MLSYGSYKIQCIRLGKFEIILENLFTIYELLQKIDQTKLCLLKLIQHLQIIKAYLCATLPLKGKGFSGRVETHTNRLWLISGGS